MGAFRTVGGGGGDQFVTHKIVGIHVGIRMNLDFFGFSEKDREFIFSALTRCLVLIIP